MLAERFYQWIDDWFYKRKYGVDFDRIELEPKEIIVFRYPKGLPPEEAVATANGITQLVNENKGAFQSPVLILQEGMELEKVPLDQLESIVKHARAISDGEQLRQQEQFIANLDSTGLEDLIPKEMK